MDRKPDGITIQIALEIIEELKAARDLRYLSPLLSRDLAERELLEIESSLADNQLKDEDRAALFGAQQALRNVLDSETSQPASQTFYRIDAPPREAASKRQHQKSPYQIMN